MLYSLLPVLLILFQIPYSLVICFKFKHIRNLLYSVLYLNIIFSCVITLSLVNFLINFFMYYFKVDQNIPFILLLEKPLTGEMFITLSTAFLIPFFYLTQVCIPLIRDANYLLKHNNKSKR